MPCRFNNWNSDFSLASCSMWALNLLINIVDTLSLTGLFKNVAFSELRHSGVNKALIWKFCMSDSIDLLATDAWSKLLAKSLINRVKYAFDLLLGRMPSGLSTSIPSGMKLLEFRNLSGWKGSSSSRLWPGDFEGSASRLPLLKISSRSRRHL